MATIAIVNGDSGTGKSHSLQHLDAKKTNLIGVSNKSLPFRGAKAKYQLITKDNPNGNYYISDQYDIIYSFLDKVEKDKRIETLVIDDFQYLMINEFIRRHSDCGKGNAVFALYNEIADHVWNLIVKLQYMRQDLLVVLLSHDEKDETGRTKSKTIGKLLDDKLGKIEGMVTIVLNTKVSDGRYTFQTQNNGANTSKSPEGMFDKEIDNNLQIVKDKIVEYYQ